MNNGFEQWWSEEGFWFCREHGFAYNDFVREMIRKLYEDFYTDGYVDRDMMGNEW